jgi:hypothetical protein
MLLLASCSGFNELEKIPPDQCHINARYYRTITAMPAADKLKKVKVDLEAIQDTLIIFPLSKELAAIAIPISAIRELKLYRYTFDIDVFTIPFKVRPAVSDFPPQLNANFSAALYFGQRLDYYQFKATPDRKRHPMLLTGVGYGYGGFIGLGSVTLNPFVTRGILPTSMMALC